MKLHVHTYGCKVNTYDSGLLEARLNKIDLGLGGRQVHVLNSCAVTAEASREAIRQARRLKTADPSAVVVVTGCAAQVDTELVAQGEGVDLVVANSHKGQLEGLLRDFAAGRGERVHKSNIFKKEDLEAGGGLETEHTRSFLKIQDGCNSFCTFCVIPFARGKSRSLSVEHLVARVQGLVAGGVREIVLTGVHIADYRDGESELADLVEALLLQTRVERLRLSSLEPGELSPRLLELYRDPRLCPHFHMSIQSANSKVLYAMKRQYDAAAVESSLEAIARLVPGSFVGMDVIAGFPTESEEDFADSYARLERLPWTQLHVFPYSARPGTYASRLEDGVGQPVRKARARRLRELSATRLAHQAGAMVGQNRTGLGLANGHLLTSDYWTLVPDRAIVANVASRAEVLAYLGGTKLQARVIS